MDNQKIEQFWQCLETMIKCPTCNKRLSVPVYMCASGHSICGVCSHKNTICSQCKSPLTAVINLLIHDLLLRYDNLKIWIAIQIAESNNLMKNPGEFIAALKHNSSNKQNNQTYRCWIGNVCNFTANIPVIVQHFKIAHADYFEENVNGNLPYSKSWEMDYSIGKNFDYAVNIGDLVFIIHMSINEIGELGACVLMYTTNAITDKYCCEIEIITVNNNKSCYKNAKVISARSPVHVVNGFKRSGLQIARNRILYDGLRENKRFKCTVILQERNIQAIIRKNNPKGHRNKFTSNHSKTERSVDQFEFIDFDPVKGDDSISKSHNAADVNELSDLNCSPESSNTASSINELNHGDNITGTDCRLS